jgi:hypothetical protein
LSKWPLSMPIVAAPGQLERDDCEYRRSIDLLVPHDLEFSIGSTRQSLCDEIPASRRGRSMLASNPASILKRKLQTLRIPLRFKWDDHPLTRLRLRPPRCIEVAPVAVHEGLLPAAAPPSQAHEEHQHAGAAESGAQAADPTWSGASPMPPVACGWSARSPSRCTRTGPRQFRYLNMDHFKEHKNLAVRLTG